MPAHALSERAARATLAAHFTPGQLAADLTEYTPAEVWDRRVRSDGSGLLASYRPSEELAQAELTCPFVIPSDEEWPTALADLGPACPLGLWVRGRDRLARLTDSSVAVTGNRVPTEQAVTRAHDFATALAEAATPSPPRSPTASTPPPTRPPPRQAGRPSPSCPAASTAPTPTPTPRCCAPSSTTAARPSASTGPAPMPAAQR